MRPPWTVAHQAPLPMGFSRQEQWSGLPFSSPGDLPDPGNKPGSPRLQVDSLHLSHPGKPFPTLATMLFCQSGMCSPCPPQSRFHKYVKIQLKLHLFWEAFPGCSGFTVLSEVLLFTVDSTHPNSFHLPILFNSPRQHTASKCLKLCETIVIQQ